MGEIPEINHKIVDIIQKNMDKYPMDLSDVRWMMQDILKAFEDAGYATVRKDRYRDEIGREYNQYTIKYSDGSGEFVRVPKFEYMTGAEWYEQFETELASRYNGKTKEGNYYSALDAARKAAGILQAPANTPSIQEEAHSQPPQTNGDILEP